jgi:formate/nitrite transporter FocA (FNT family)
MLDIISRPPRQEEKKEAAGLRRLPTSAAIWRDFSAGAWGNAGLLGKKSSNKSTAVSEVVALVAGAMFLFAVAFVIMSLNQLLATRSLMMLLV